MWYVYSIDMFNKDKGEWQTDLRWYRREKQLDEFDLIHVKGKRKNATFLFQDNNPPFHDTN